MTDTFTGQDERDALLSLLHAIALGKPVAESDVPIAQRIKVALDILTKIDHMTDTNTTNANAVAVVQLTADDIAALRESLLRKLAGLKAADKTKSVSRQPKPRRTDKPRA